MFKDGYNGKIYPDHKNLNQSNCKKGQEKQIKEELKIWRS